MQWSAYEQSCVLLAGDKLFLNEWQERKQTLLNKSSKSLAHFIAKNISLYYHYPFEAEARLNSI
jgi:hypothetical protein